MGAKAASGDALQMLSANEGSKLCRSLGRLCLAENWSRLGECVCSSLGCQRWTAEFVVNRFLLAGISSDHLPNDKEPKCVRPGCVQAAWNHQQGEFCSQTCRDAPAGAEGFCSNATKKQRESVAAQLHAKGGQGQPRLAEGSKFQIQDSFHCCGQLPTKLQSPRSPAPHGRS